MNLHEFQAKQLFTRYAIPAPQGAPASTGHQARQVAKELGGGLWIVKAQVHSGGRGKAGGVRKVDSLDSVAVITDQLLARRLVTEQTTAQGLPVRQVLVEKQVDIQREFYLAVLVDRVNQCIMLVVSTYGGIAIEETAESSPDAVLALSINTAVGLQTYQCRRIAFFLGLGNNHRKQLQIIIEGLYRLFTENDASIVEINPIVITADDQLLAVDAKLTIDDNALFKHNDLAELFDPSQQNEAEIIAQDHGLNYIMLDGNVACMVNGAGLAMATMDLIRQQGGTPANFLDVGGGTTADRVTEAFKLILADKQVKSILVNIFGGIVHCDLIAKGIIQSVKQVELSLPVVVRLEGTHAAQGRQLLANSGMNIRIAGDLVEAASQAVMAAKEGWL